MSYKCTNQFVSSKGRRYTYGEKYLLLNLIVYYLMNKNNLQGM